MTYAITPITPDAFKEFRFTLSFMLFQNITKIANSTATGTTYSNIEKKSLKPCVIITPIFNLK